MFEVYLHTSPTGKGYVGQTVSGKKRWREHLCAARKGDSRPLYRAIRKYGAEAFRTVLLERVTTEKAAHLAEMLWIRELGTFVPGGYNLTLGGEGTVGRSVPLSANHKAKLSAIFKGRKPKPVDEDTRKKMSASAKKRAPQQYTQERAARISASLTGKRATVQGEDRHQSKLTAAMVAEIRRALPSVVGYGKLKALADQFGISSSAVCDIRAGRTWKVVP